MSKSIRQPRNIKAEKEALRRQQEEMAAAEREQWADLIEATVGDLDEEALSGLLLMAVDQMYDERAVERWRKRAQEAFQQSPGPSRRGRRPRSETADSGDESASDTAEATPSFGVAA